MAAEKAGDSRLSVDSGPFVFHYLIQADVCYLTLTDKSYPKKLAYQYLEELQSEFSRLYGDQIAAAARPYAFIKFGEALGLLACRATVFRSMQDYVARLCYLCAHASSWPAQPASGGAACCKSVPLHCLEGGVIDRSSA